MIIKNTLIPRERHFFLIYILVLIKKIMLLIIYNIQWRHKTCIDAIQLLLKKKKYIYLLWSMKNIITIISSKDDEI